MVNCLTLGLYGAFFLIFSANRIGKLAGANYPGPILSIALTIISLGIYPGIILPVLAFKLGEMNDNSVGVIVLLLDIVSLVTAVLGGFFIFVSVILWAHAIWLLIEAESALSIKDST